MGWTIRSRPAGVGLAAMLALCHATGAVRVSFAGSPSPTSPAPTYTRDIEPLLRVHCRGCHRAGDVGPFALETYEQARKRARDIAGVVAAGEMPPWKPEPGVGPALKHARVLAPAEVELLRRWATTGAARGEGDAVAPPRADPDGWSFGTPDLVLEALEDFEVPASGPDLYRCFVIPTKLDRDVTVAAIEYRPGNRRVAHHMMAFIDTSGEGRVRDAADPGPGYTSFAGAGVGITGDLGGWAAGNSPSYLPEGVGRILARRSDVIVQVHYHPSGKPEKDRPRIALYYSKTPLRQTLQWANASNDNFVIPAGRRDVEVKATWFVPVDVDALAVTPHMHALGRDFRMTVTYPNGKTRDLIHIPDWDPSWQDTYYFDEPQPLPKNSTVTIVARYDNSAHPRNPHRPPKTVRQGPEVSDEMCVGYIGVVKRGQDLTKPGEKDDLFDILSRQKLAKMRKEWGQAQRRSR